MILGRCRCCQFLYDPMIDLSQYNANNAYVLYSDTRCRLYFFFSSRRRHTILQGDWSSDVCSSDLPRSRASGTKGKRAAVWNDVEPMLVDLASALAARDPATAAHCARVTFLSRRLAEIGRASCRERV